MSDFFENENVELEDEVQTEDVAVEEVEGEGEEEVDPDDDLQESLDVIEEEKEAEENLYDEDNNYVGDTEDEVFKDSWESPEFTPESSDIPMTFEILEAAGESMMAEGDAILDILGPSENEAFNKIVLENEEGVVSYPDPENPFGIVIEDSTGKEGDDFEGMSTSSDRDEFVFEDDEEEIEVEEETPVEGEEINLDEPLTLSEDDYEL